MVNLHSADAQSMLSRLVHVLLQVFSMLQSAIMLVHCDPHTSELLPLLDEIAAQAGFATEQEIIADKEHGLTAVEWMQFWKYTERVNPFIVTCVDYVPVHEQTAGSDSAQPSLY